MAKRTETFRVMPEKVARFKVWSYDDNEWVRDNFDQYVELNWTLSDSPGDEECFVDVKSRTNAVIVFANTDGNYEVPDEPEDDLPF